MRSSARFELDVGDEAKLKANQTERSLLQQDILCCFHWSSQDVSVGIGDIPSGWGRSVLVFVCLRRIGLQGAEMCRRRLMRAWSFGEDSLGRRGWWVR